MNKPGEGHLALDQAEPVTGMSARKRHVGLHYELPHRLLAFEELDETASEFHIPNLVFGFSEDMLMFDECSSRVGKAKGSLCSIQLGSK